MRRTRKEISADLKFIRECEISGQPLSPRSRKLIDMNRAKLTQELKQLERVPRNAKRDFRRVRQDAGS
jgi:hypothetical protein